MLLAAGRRLSLLLFSPAEAPSFILHPMAPNKKIKMPLPAFLTPAVAVDVVDTPAVLRFTPVPLRAALQMAPFIAA